MILIHENLQNEADWISSRLEEIYQFPVGTINENLGGLFIPLPEFNGFFTSFPKIEEILADTLKTNKIMILTPRDLYAGNISQNDDWVLGYCHGNLTVVSSARMKRADSKPSKTLEIPEEDYRKRIECLAVHEIGHDVIDAKHHKMATWVNINNGRELQLGPHCDDNTCVMYEVVDIQNPPSSEGYMRLGEEKKYDTGLAGMIERMRDDWFCERCKSSIKIDESYFRT